MMVVPRPPSASPPLLLLLLTLWTPAHATTALFGKTSTECGDVLSEFHGPSRLHCAASCLKRSTCAAWRYDLASAGCTLWSVVGIGQVGQLQTDVFAFPLPTGYVLGPDRIAYTMVATGVIWSGIQAGCSANDSRATPAVPTTDASVELLKTFGAQDMYVFMGLQCTTGTSYVDYTGSGVALKASWFASGAIDPFSSEELGCVSMRSTGLYHHTCAHTHRFVCQIQLT
ncbi:hypothetical protein FJT64_023488 [Amphibalanus amphitrite]|uniref:Apple domain-containing protein n=1 Tax=Amphibalanus amphitrite TaxID=1232801 RepID=A0A6A4WAD5_AMPAM|nr:hypothetical protein FJT64_023488 [Amphibalanus amphitrite]